MRSLSLKVSRDAILLGSALAGLAYETISGHPDPTLIGTFAGMIGLTGALHTDEALRKPPPAPKEPPV